MFHQTLPLDTQITFSNSFAPCSVNKFLLWNPNSLLYQYTIRLFIQLLPNRAGREPGSTGNQTQPFPLSDIGTSTLRSLIVKRRDVMVAVPRVLELESP